jgi:hypothetical protein
VAYRSSGCVITNIMYSRSGSERAGNVALYRCRLGPLDIPYDETFSGEDAIEPNEGRATPLRRLIPSVSVRLVLRSERQQRVQAYGTAVVPSVFDRGGDELG